MYTMKTRLINCAAIFFMLMHLSSGVCPDNYINIKDYTCVHFGNAQSLNWNDARTYCKDISGDLAIVGDCSKLVDIVYQISHADNDIPTDYSYWIGGSDTVLEGNWKWVDGTDVPRGVPFWGVVKSKYESNIEPGGGEAQNCLMMYKNDNYYFHDGDCSSVSFPLCETEHY